MASRFPSTTSKWIGASGFLDEWHNYRAPVLLLLLLGLVLARTYRDLRRPAASKLGIDRDGEKEPVVLTLSAAAQAASTLAAASTDGPRRIKGAVKRRGSEEKGGQEPGAFQEIQVVVFFSSITGTTEKLATSCVETLAVPLAKYSGSRQYSFARPQIRDLSEVELDEYFINVPPTHSDGRGAAYFYLIILPSYDIDTINDNLLEHLKDTHNDFRIDNAPLSSLLGYSVFGIGDRLGWPNEAEGYCRQAFEVDKWMAKLTGRKRAYPLGSGNASGDVSERLGEWVDGVLEVLENLAKTGSLGEGVPGSGDAVESDDEAISDEDGEVLFENQEKITPPNTTGNGSINDIEDLGSMMDRPREEPKQKADGRSIAVDFTDYGRPERKKPQVQVAKEMVPKSSPTFAALTKQGYTIVGSHSGVKICRWTKSALRGRGSCYKFSFYGINSHQCMETTPSLSCSNKCVFCWRHGTNPVGTSWRWVVDPPQLIFDGVKAGHYQKIKTLRGVPGVRAERFAEAMRIRHCALSLVGEPVFYPHINEFLNLLHAERISSFLVCNAQHPDQLAALKHVTQLYVSIDASNKESLKRIDRPLHRDFWERFQRCLSILRERRFRQRTVFRLTLVKGFNIDDEVEGYANLVEQGLPCFVEIKGVTFCGKGSGLTMDSVPFYHEVCDFVTALEQALHRRGLKYGIAAEHAHSCCVLLASERFKVDDKWHTVIDYDRFFELLEQKGSDGDFSPEDYMGPETPEWATWGNGGFDPRDDRVDRKGRKIEK